MISGSFTMEGGLHCLFRHSQLSSVQQNVQQVSKQVSSKPINTLGKLHFSKGNQPSKINGMESLNDQVADPPTPHCLLGQ